MTTDVVYACIVTVKHTETQCFSVFHTAQLFINTRMIHRFEKNDLHSNDTTEILTC